jgi:hypothetical protein
MFDTLPESQAVYISPDGVSYPHSTKENAVEEMPSDDHALISNPAGTLQCIESASRFAELSQYVQETSFGQRIMSADEHPTLPKGTMGTVISFQDETIKGTPPLTPPPPHPTRRPLL